MRQFNTLTITIRELRLKLIEPSANKKQLLEATNKNI